MPTTPMRRPQTDVLEKLAGMILMAGSDLGRVINVEHPPADADDRLRRVYDLLGRAHTLCSDARKRSADAAQDV